MVTTTYPAGKRPRIRVFDTFGKENPLPNLVLTKINSKSAYFRSSHVVGEMALSISSLDGGRVEIIKHVDGTPVLESEQWPPLTPYDTGARLEPAVWVLPDRRRPEEFEPDRYGKVDFNDDTDTTLATVHAERVEACHVLVVYSHETNSEARINLDADLDLIQARILGEASQPGTLTVERLVKLMREHDKDGAWIDADDPEFAGIDGRFDLAAIVAAINGTEETS
jgi:hypothetical protein